MTTLEARIDRWDAKNKAKGKCSKSREEYLEDIASMLATINLFFRRAEVAAVGNKARMAKATALVNEQLAELAKDEDHWA